MRTRFLATQAIILRDKTKKIDQIMKNPKEMTNEEWKKFLEEICLEEFLKLPTWGNFHIVERGESPDFLIEDGLQKIGIEVTRLFKDEGEKGSKMKMVEKERYKFLWKVADNFYKTCAVKCFSLDADLNNSLNVKDIPGVVDELIKRPFPQFPKREMYKTKIGTLYLSVLPERDGFDNYVYLQCYNNSRGTVWPINKELIEKKIKCKAENLEEYKKKADRIVLLIVADKSRESSMLYFDSKPLLLSKNGFFEVYFLSAPGQFHRLA